MRYSNRSHRYNSRRRMFEEMDTNIDLMKNDTVVIDPTMGDAVRRMPKRRKEFNKMINRDMDYRERFTGNKSTKDYPPEPILPKSAMDEDISRFASTISKRATRIGYSIAEMMRDYPEYTEQLRSLSESLSNMFNPNLIERCGKGTRRKSINENHSFSNGALEDFDVQGLVNKVINQKRSLFTTRDFGDMQYDIFISPHGPVDEPDDITVDIITNEPDGSQERIFLKSYSSFDDVTAALEEWKQSILDKPVDDMVEEALNEDGRRDSKLPKASVEQKRADKAEDADPWTVLFSEFDAGEWDSDKYLKVGLKHKERYDSDVLGTTYDGDITVTVDDKDKLANAKKIADAYKLPFTIKPIQTRSGGKFQFILKVPDEWKE